MHTFPTDREDWGNDLYGYSPSDRRPDTLVPVSCLGSWTNNHAYLSLEAGYRQYARYGFFLKGTPRYSQRDDTSRVQVGAPLFLL